MPLLSRVITRQISLTMGSREACRFLQTLAERGNLRTGPLAHERWQIERGSAEDQTIELSRAESAFFWFRGASRIRLEPESEAELRVHVWIPRRGPHALLGLLPLAPLLGAAPVGPRWLSLALIGLAAAFLVVVEHATGRESLRCETVLGRLEAALLQGDSGRLRARYPELAAPDSPDEVMAGVERLKRPADQELELLAGRVETGTIELIEPHGVLMRADPRSLQMMLRRHQKGRLHLELAEEEEGLDWRALELVSLDERHVGFRVWRAPHTSQVATTAGTALGFAAMLGAGYVLLSYLSGEAIQQDSIEVTRTIICLSWLPAYHAWSRSHDRAPQDVRALLCQVRTPAGE